MLLFLGRHLGRATLSSVCAYKWTTLQCIDVTWWVTSSSVKLLAMESKKSVIYKKNNKKKKNLLKIRFKK